MISRGHIHCVNGITRKLREHSHSIPKGSSKESDLSREGKRARTLSIASCRRRTVEDPAVVISRNSWSGSDRRPSHHEFIDRDEVATRDGGGSGRRKSDKISFISLEVRAQKHGGN